MAYKNFKSYNKKKDYRYKKKRGTERGSFSLCPICNRPVKELFNAICHRESGKAAHFDCIIKLIRQQEELTQNEKICYLGNGSFGIIRQQKSQDLFPFVIRKRIQYEDTHTTPLWRKPLNNGAKLKSSG